MPQLLRDGMGVNALARLERDVLAQPGIRIAIVGIGINDIGFAGTPFLPNAPLPTAEAMMAAYRALVDRAHACGVRVIAATLTPFAGALPDTPFADSYWSPVKDRLRHQVNDWIRTSGTFDAVVDFDRLLADPARPVQLDPRYDSGDQLHPNDAGNHLMAEAVDPAVLRGPVETFTHRHSVGPNIAVHA